MPGGSDGKASAYNAGDMGSIPGRFLEMGIPDHLICSSETCVQVKKQQLELDMEQQTGSKLGKEYVKAVYCHSAYLTYILHHEKRWAGGSTSWNQDFWEKYQ